MIKAILFDFDGVLTIEKTGSQSIINYIVSKTGISYSIFENAYYKYNKGLLLGKYTHKDIWNSLCRDAGFNIDFRLLIESFENTELDTNMLMLVRELRQQYKTGMITDNKADRIDVITKKHRFDEIFDVVSVSAKLHSGKDNHIIFKHTTAALNVTEKECVFIDNTPKNLEIPRQIGMKTILFDDENRNIDEFRKTLKMLCIEA